jgi:hypothetical protein
MIVRCFWPKCDFRNGEWGATRIDAFWVEATRDEAIQAVFPLLSSEAQARSMGFSSECSDLAEKIAQPPRPFCFLVAKDLSSIDPFHVHYPFHQLWNADSPFRAIAERLISSLDELVDL